MTASRSHTWALVTFVLMSLATPAFGGRVTLSFEDWIGSSWPCHWCTEYPEIATYPGSSELKWVGGPYGSDTREFWYSFGTFRVPEGQAIFSAKMTLSFAHEIRRSYEAPLFGVLPLDPDQPSSPGRVMATAITMSHLFFLFAGNCEVLSYDNFQNFDLKQQNCDPLTNGVLAVSVFGTSFTQIVPTVLDPGFNAETIVDMGGGNWTPITGVLDVVYTPESSPLTLIGGGIVLLVGLAFWRRAHLKHGCRVWAGSF